jgi:hypothetical protein
MQAQSDEGLNDQPSDQFLPDVQVQHLQRIHDGAASPAQNDEVTIDGLTTFVSTLHDSLHLPFSNNSPILVSISERMIEICFQAALNS